VSKEIDRRDFISVIFGTVSTVALSGTLSDRWPTKAKKRPKAEPIVFHLENGYIVDPDFDYEANWPTVRENRYDCLSTAHAIDLFYELIGNHSETYDYLEKEIGKPAEKWSKAELTFLEDYFEEKLDEKEDPENFSFQASAKNSEYSAGIQVLERLGDKRAKELGLYLVEGDCPGSSFCGVAFDGDIEGLNLELVRRGLNLSIEQSA
jgi:hypothetical protein